MPLEPALRSMLTQTITQSSYAGQDMYGKPSYGPPQERPARIELLVETVMDQSGQERVSNTRVTCDGDLPINLRDRLVLPDGSSPAIQAVYALDDPEMPHSIHHYEIRL